MKLLLLSTSLIVTLLSAGWGGRALQRARTAEAERAALLAAQPGQAAERRRLEQRLQSAAAERVELQAALASARAPAKPAPADKLADGGRGAASVTAINPAEAIAKDPKLQSLYLASRRAAFATNYGPFIAARGLTAAQAEKLNDAKLRHHEQDMDLRNIMETQKLSPRDPAITELRQRADLDLREALVAVLGEADYAEFQRYEGTLPARAIAERFAGAAALGDVPISAQQAEQLTQIMAAAGVAQPARATGPNQIDWAAVDAQAARVLSPVQLALFRRIEPIGGGASRWSAELSRAMEEARQRSGGQGWVTK